MHEGGAEGVSVMVKDMKMPEDCACCRFLRQIPAECGDYWCIAANQRRRYSGWFDKDSWILPDWCPLVEVPENHGRLIDADKLSDFTDALHKVMIFGGQTVYSQSAIDNAPTVIEEEGEG